MATDDGSDSGKQDHHSHNERTLRTGSFYTITDDGSAYVLLDRTKRGLEPKERSVDEKTGIEADMGVIYGMDGVGHKVPIRWYYTKDAHDISDVTDHADSIEKRYTELRELTCPDG